MPVSTRPATTVHPAVRPGGRPLTAEDLWRVPRVGTPQPSPDGRFGIVPVTAYDLEKNEGRTRLWLVPADGRGEPRPLTAPEASSSQPRVSPDGRRVAFVRKRDKAEKAQLHVLPLDGGEAEKLTDLPLGVSDPRWFPDGRRIAFVSPLVKGHLTIEATKQVLEERDKNPVKAHATEDRIYRFWDHWLDTGEVPHLWVLDLDTRELKDVTPASNRWFEFMDSEGVYDISPDGREITFSACINDPPYRFVRWALFTVPAGGGEVTCLTPDHPADDARPRYSPDGRFIVYGMQVEPFFYADRVRLVRYDRASREHVELAPDWDRSAMAWEFDGPDRLLLRAEDRARVHVYSVPVAGGTPQVVLEGGVVGGHAVAAGRLFVARQHMSQPPEAWVAGADGASPLQLTRFTDEALAGIALGEVQEIEYEGARGDQVQMWIVLPPGFDARKKWPLVHVIHGGPHGASADDFHFRWNGHAFAAAGYVAVMVNFHGSTSWGQEFAQCIQGLWGDMPMEDVERGTDTMLGLGYIDGQRMAITGASYGGYLVSWIGTHTDRYACIVNHAGVYDTLCQYASDVTQGRHKSFGGEPWDGLENIDRWNPARFAAGWNTPTLVIHGEQDYRVPLVNGLSCYNVLQGKGVPSRLVYFPDENHWVLKPRNSIYWYGEVHSWLARYLKRA
jgi:dipeptidyl aminopeptidase/acylaminoacyl peptidase